MKDIEVRDVLHLYSPQSGLQIVLPADKGVGEFYGINNSMMVQVFINGGIVSEYVNYVQPILRNLDSMTEEEDDKFHEVNGDWIDGHWTPKGMVYLLSKGFDLFSLIERGHAIRKTN